MVIIIAGGGHINDVGGIVTIVDVSGDGRGDDTGSRGQVVVGSSPSWSLLMVAVTTLAVGDRWWWSHRQRWWDRHRCRHC